MSGRVVIVAYRPKAGRERQLEKLVLDHWSRLKTVDLVTDRRPVVLTCADGNFVEVFEWKSAEAIRRAHENPTVQLMWEEFEACCTYVPAAEITEFKDLFSEFAPAN